MLNESTFGKAKQIAFRQHDWELYRGVDGFFSGDAAAAVSLYRLCIVVVADGGWVPAIILTIGYYKRKFAPTVSAVAA